MSEYRAWLAWRSDGAFASGRYSRRHELRFDGGLAVPFSASPEIVREPMSDPAAVDPEEALVAAVASCHMLFFLSLAQAAGWEVEQYLDEAVGEMGQTADGRVAITRIGLRPRIAFVGGSPSLDQIDQIHHEAHQRCFIANSLRTEVIVETGSGDP